MARSGSDFRGKRRWGRARERTRFERKRTATAIPADNLPGHSSAAVACFLGADGFFFFMGAATGLDAPPRSRARGSAQALPTSRGCRACAAAASVPVSEGNEQAGVRCRGRAMRRVPSATRSGPATPADLHVKGDKAVCTHHPATHIAHRGWWLRGALPSRDQSSLLPPWGAGPFRHAH